MDFHQAISNKEFLENKNITLIEGNKIVTSKNEFAKTFSENYINIVKISSGIKPKDIFERSKNQNIAKTISEIVKIYEDHSILLIKNIWSFSFNVKEKLCFRFVKEIEIKKLIKRLNSYKATG